MPRNVYSEIHLHRIWRTKSSEIVLLDDIERHTQLRQRALQTQVVIVRTVDGIPDHVHMAVTVPPTITISDGIADLKGGSSYFINREIANRRILEWQTGYGVVSFGAKDLPWVVRYVRKQKEHRAKGTIRDRLQRIDQPTDETAPKAR